MELDQMDSVYLTRQNLKLVLGQGRRTLDYRIASLIKKGVLMRLKKGFYVNLGYFDKSPVQSQLLEYLGSVMVYPSYLSGETVLAQRGFLAESVYGCTYVTTKKTRQIVTDRVSYIYQKVKPDLFFGFNTVRVDKYEYKVATLAKALFDFLYLATGKMNKKEMGIFLIDSRFNWSVLNKQDRTDFRAIITRTGIPKMQLIAKNLAKYVS